MLHCSLDFSSIGLSVATHSRWNEAQTQCALHLFADHGHTQALLPELPATEARDFARYMMHCALPAEMGEEGTHRIEGVVALTLTNFLLHLFRQAEEVSHVAEAPDLMGFWEPPAWRVPSEGIILWFHPDDGYHAIIPRGRNQATEVIQRLSWLEYQRRELLLAKINRWNTPSISPHPAQDIRGVCAQVLCIASAAARVRHAILEEYAGLRLRPKRNIVNGVYRN